MSTTPTEGTKRPARPADWHNLAVELVLTVIVVAVPEDVNWFNTGISVAKALVLIMLRRAPGWFDARRRPPPSPPS